MELMKRKRRFGPVPKPLAELKLKQVVVRFTRESLERIDQLRGSIPRAVWLHDAGLQQSPPPPPPVFPEVNRAVWAELAQGPMSNMHQIKYWADKLEVERPGEGWKVLAENYSELIDISHRLRDGLLTVIPIPEARK